MESFSISCTTCQTQLRVRDRSAIGQILTCPKCGSMVLVEPPQEEKAAAEDRVAPPPLPQPGPVEEPEHIDAVVNLADTVDDPTLYGIVTEPQGERQFDDVSAVEAGDLSVAGPLDQTPLVPGEQWSSPSLAAWRRGLLLAGAAAAGVVLAVLLFAWWSRGDSDRVAAPVVAPGATESADPAAVSPAGTASPSGPAASADTAAQASLPTAEKSPGGSNSQPAVPAPPDPAEPLGLTPPSSAKAEQDPSKAAASAQPVPGGKAAAPETGGDAATSAADPAEPPKPAGPLTPADSLRETLRQFGVLLDKPDSAASGTGSAVEMAPGARIEASDVPRPQPLDIDLESRLGDAIGQIDFNGVPLIEFLNFVSDFSTIPISLDPDVLPFLGISPDTAVAVRQEKTTVEALLTRSLEPLRLGFVAADNQLLVTRIDPTGPRVRQVTFACADFPGVDAKQIGQIAQLIRELVVPESWDSGGGTGTIHIENSDLVVRQQEIVLYEVLRFYEKLRVANGLAPRSNKLPASLFQLTPRGDKAASRLQTLVSLNYFRPEPFDRIVRRLGKETDTHLLIDWRSAGQMGWNPQAQRTFACVNQPLTDALRALLEPMDLTYRVVDENLVQILSRQARDAHLEVEFYPVRDLLGTGLTGDQLLQKLAASLGEGMLQEKGGLGLIRLHAPSRCLIAMLPQPHQQLLAKSLRQFRDGTVTRR